MRSAAGLSFDLGDYEGAFDAAIQKATTDNLVERIWQRDHTIWQPDPNEVSDRLGWLDVAARMHGEVDDLRAFAEQLRGEGLTHVLVLGMGGSSLAPELFGAFYSGNGLQLGVLDSTDPDAVRATAAAFDPRKTLYIVSSKSGGTVETFSFFKFFYNQAQIALGNRAGEHFAAITDPGSGLGKMADRHNFRRVFLADPNIGGRYSALTHFGLVPAALAGADLNALLDSAEAAAAMCKEPVENNPGALLGLALGALAAQGHDKLTLRTPERLAGFADWAEQLVAESSGKNGKGILPVAHEPRLQAYGDDRVFVNFGDAGHSIAPNIRVDWSDGEQLGGLFFIWEFATAVAGYVLGINPFDQPNVESAKVQTRTLVDQFRKTGQLPSGPNAKASVQALAEFMAQAKPSDYIALQAYAAPTEELTAALQTLRVKLGSEHKLATTLGYGPRFLHSTGQLHKGDGGNGLFVQFVTPPPGNDVPIPAEAGQPQSDISFGVLKVAQAQGDAQALHEAGRRVISFELPGDPVAAIGELA